MPVLGKKYQKTIQLAGYPEDDPATVTIVTNPTTEAWEGTDTVSKEESSNLVLSRIITAWNFTDEAGQPLPINPENVKGALSTINLTQVYEALGFTSDSMLSVAKKNS